MQADTMIVSRLTHRYTAVTLGISYDEMYEYLYYVCESIKSKDHFTVTLAE